MVTFYIFKEEVAGGSGKLNIITTKRLVLILLSS